jgi:hypothetical protein
VEVVAVVGASLAGLRAVEELRAAGFFPGTCLSPADPIPGRAVEGRNRRLRLNVSLASHMPYPVLPALGGEDENMTRKLLNLLA